MSGIQNLMTKDDEIDMDSNTVYHVSADWHYLTLPKTPDFGDLVGVQALGEATHFCVSAPEGQSMRFLDFTSDATDSIQKLTTQGCGQNVYLTYSPDGFWMVSSCMGNFDLSYDKE